ncbi:HAD family hydrolase [Kiloniella majae]|uniref:HAD family hydrolase n=1 Tax=Kiloniella majae TaxID=1938558 RepID=UPI000A278A6E|nr:HAD family phosphatase [Kiloniella majae]
MIKNVVFDFGGVLIDWNLRYLYQSEFSKTEEMERFLRDVFTFDANHRLDAGESFSSVIGELQEKFPEYKEVLALLLTRWPDTLGDEITGTVETLEKLHAQQTPLYGLTNWSEETFPHAEARFPFLQYFKGITVSGTVKLAKPDPKIYHRLLSDFSLEAQECVFIDDREDNIMVAKDLGFKVIHFTDPVLMNKALLEFGMLKD